MEEEQAGQEKTPGFPGVFSAPVLTAEQPPDGLSRCEHRLLFFFLPIQPFQVLPQGQVDIAGNGAVIVLRQPLDPLVDGVIDGNADSGFQWFHAITCLIIAFLAEVVD